MAAVPFLRAAQARQAELDQYGRIVSQLGLYAVGKALDHPGLAEWRFDGDALFLETFTVEGLKDDYGLQASQSQVDRVCAALRDLYKALEPAPRPRPYYAVLKMDGDHVGERLGQCQTRQEHQDFSNRMRQFAEAAGQVVNLDFAGRLVYSGGDDVLALAPIDQALPMAKALRDKYHALTGGGISAGIVIAHHRDSLDGALAAARQAELAAKAEYRLDDKDAVHIVAFKRSGEALRVGTTWETGNVDPINLFETLQTAFQQDGALSSKLAYAAADELPAFDATPAYAALPAEARRAAIKRLVKRHRDAQRDSQGATEPDKLAGELNQWAQALDDGAAGKANRARGGAELAQWLLLARFIAGGGE
jgi:CRISPR-associated protein Cmr2